MAIALLGDATGRLASAAAPRFSPAQIEAVLVVQGSLRAWPSP